MINIKTSGGFHMPVAQAGVVEPVQASVKVVHRRRRLTANQLKNVRAAILIAARRDLDFTR